MGRAILTVLLILTLIAQPLWAAFPPATRIAAAASGGLADTPWPMFHHDLQHTGRSPYSGPTLPALKWTYQVDYAIRPSPAIGSDGTIYFGFTGIAPGPTYPGKLYALNPDGTLKWSYQPGQGVGHSPAIGADGTIYFGSHDGKFYALNPDGTLKWSYQTAGAHVITSPAIGADGTIYAGTIADGWFYAFNPDGTLKWSYQPGSHVYGSPAIAADGTIYFGSQLDKKLYALNPDGTLKWTYQAQGNVRSPAVGADGTIYFGDEEGQTLYALNPDGSLKWSYDTGGTAAASPAIGSDGTIYIGAGVDKLYALNPDGTLKWSYTTGGATASSPAIGADGTIYVGSSDGKLYAINPDGTLKWTYTTGGAIHSSPAIGADGTIYVGSDDGKLYAIGRGAEKIIFYTDRDGNGEIYSMNIDGSLPANLTNNTALDQEPDPSPGGDKIAFRSDRDGDHEIYVMNADGSRQTRLTYSPGADGWPTWSPDGSKLAFQTHRNGNWDIYVMNADGTGQTNLTSGITAPDLTPAWSPDGNKIAFTSGRDGNYEIYVMNSDGSGQTRLTSNAAEDWWPRWSPDGSKIVFRSRRDGNDEIYVMNADGSNQTRLTQNPANDAWPSWSRDGSKIVFASDRDGNYEIYVMNADGSNQTRLTNNSAIDWHPRWAVILDITLPPVPSLISPASGAKVSDTTPALDWTDVTDPSGVSYSLQVDDDSDFSSPVLSKTGLTSSIYTLADTEALAGGTYYWRVKAIDSAGNESAWSSAWSFTVDIPLLPPANLTKISPDNNPLPAFRWDAVPDAVSYEVKVDSGSWTDIGNKTTYVQGTVLAKGNHTIAVRAVDGAGNKGSAASLDFTVSVVADLANTKIVFSSDRDGNREIYLMNPDGSSSTRLTVSSDWNGYPSWSPDGSKIVFDSLRDGGNAEIYIMNADGSNQTRLTSNSVEDADPDLSPDGSKIVFQRGSYLNHDLYVMNLDGSGEMQLTTHSADDIQADWSPDGGKIVFASNRDGDFEIYVMNADGTDQIQLTSNSALDWHPVWSPDGTKIAFWSDRDGNGEIYVMNADGSGQTRLTTNSALDEQPHWSPDGNKIVFQSLRDGNYEIYVMNSDGTAQTRLTSNMAGDFMAAWSPFLPAPLPAPTGLSRTTPDNDNTPTFTWDAVSGAASYEVKVDTGDYSDIGNVTAYTVPATLADGSHTFYVRAKDSVYQTGSSASLSFSIDTAAPAAPSLFSPASGAKVSDTTPALDWADVTDPSGVSYSLQVGNEDFSIIFWSREGLTLSEYTLADPEALSEGTYHWRVRARDGAGNDSGWTPAETFSIDLSPPETVIIIAPSQVTSSSEVTLSWAGSDNYTLSSDLLYSYWLQGYDADWSEFSSSAAGTYAALADGVYMFQVRAQDEAGNIDPLPASVEFTVDAGAPGIPALSSPLNGAKTSDTTPTFGWLEVADLTGVNYILEISSSVDFSILTRRLEELASSTYTLTEAEALAEGTYYWRVKAIDGAGNEGEWSTPWAFTVDTTVQVWAIIAPTGGMVQTPDERIILAFPAGAVAEVIPVTIKQEPAETLPEPPEGYKPTATYFAIEAPATTLEKSITITVKYTDADVAAVGGKEEQLVLGSYLESEGSWRIFDTTVDTAARTLSTTTTHFSKWAVLAKQPPLIAKLLRLVILGIAILAAAILMDMVLRWWRRLIPHRAPALPTAPPRPRRGPRQPRR